MRTPRSILLFLMPYLPRWGTLVSSLLIVAAYPPWDFRYLIWICLIPWFFTLSRTKDWRQALGQGLWFSVLMSWFGFPWVAYVLHEFGEIPWVVAIFGLGLYSLVGQPQFLIFGPVFRFFRKANPLLASLGLALFYAGIDWLLPKIFKDTLGHAFYSASWLRQVAELGGAHLLTFGAAWLNLALFYIADSCWNAKACKAPRLQWVNLALSLLLIAALTAFGAVRDREWKEKLAHPDKTVQGAIIQANIGDFDKVAAEQGMQGAAERILAQYFSLSDEALALTPRPEFVMWPETAYASTYRKPMTTADFSRDQRIDNWSRNNHVPLLFGSYDRAFGRDYNTFYLLSPQPMPPEVLDPEHSTSNDLQFYHKNILLMFGEYIPFQDEFPALGRLFPQVANFGRGSGAHVVNTPLASGGTLPSSPVICYEVLFPDYVIHAANLGSRMILNITNDSWFGPWGEPHLHLALSTFRSIETRLPQVRSTNTGFSALITQDGEIASKSHLFQPEILSVAIPLIDPPSTLMKRWGDWFGQFAFILGISILGLLFHRIWGIRGIPGIQRFRRSQLSNL